MGATESAISVVGIPTRDRTESLTRCLESCLENNRRHGRATSFAVVDDSSTPEVRQANRAAVKGLAGRHGVEVTFIGADEKRHFLQALTRHGGFDPDVLAFALLNPEGCPLATGSSRNALLLHAAGEMLLQLDDDTLCQVVCVPGARDEVVSSSLFDPTEFWFLDEGELPETVEAVDLLALHERLLGRSLDGCASGMSAERAPGKVLVTSAGVAGHSGMGSSVYFLRLQGASRKRLLGSEDVYRRALADHRVLRAVTRATVCSSAYCMAVNLGLDNRGLLPPFFPVQRNQDGVFAALLRAVRPDGCHGFLPWAIRHEPPAPRSYSRADLLRSAARLSTGQLVQGLVRSIPVPCGDPGGRAAFERVGRALQEWSALTPVDFEELLRIRLGPSQGRQVAQLEGMLQEYHRLPQFWSADVCQVLAVLREGASARLAAPADLAAKGDEEATRLFQRLVGRFGRLLCCWPDIVEAARTLRQRGVRPGA